MNRLKAIEKTMQLGDGLYAEDRGSKVILHSPRLGSVSIDDQTLMTFFAFIERARGLKITVETIEKKNDE